MKRKTIALITNDFLTYSGGRYYIQEVIKAINQLEYNLIVVTNMDSPAREDFAHLGDHQQIFMKDLRRTDIEADLYIGTPEQGGMRAIELAERYIKPSLVMLFDSLPMMEKYYPEDVKDEVEFKGEFFAKIEQSNTNILVLAESNRISILESGWLGRRPDQIFSLSPCVNEHAMDMASEPEIMADAIIMTSRMVPRKNFPQAVSVLKNINDKYKLYIISNTVSNDIMTIIRNFGLTDRVVFFKTISDVEKFGLLKRCKVAINTSHFEGFGMFVIEARACGVPIVVNDLPVFREIKEMSNDNGIYIAKRGNDANFVRQIKKALSKEHKVVRYYTFSRLKRQTDEIINCLI